MIVEPTEIVAAHSGIGVGTGFDFAVWFTVMRRPAPVTEPVRAAPVLFASIVKVNVPLPEPDAPSVSQNAAPR